MSWFELVGQGLAGYLLVRLVLYLSKFVRPPVNVAQLGEWALVTGATDGIGKGFAEELARRGLNIVLVSRTLDKLQAVAAEIEAKHKVKTKVIPLDFTKAEEVFDTIATGIQGIENSIGVLVNNVGIGYEHPEFYLEIEDCAQRSRDMVSCNISSIVNVTRAVLPGMVANKQGAVINLSSFSALQTSPLLSLYSATKAFVIQWSKNMQVEYGGKGITFQALAPYYVVSKLSKVRTPSLTIPTPETYCRSALSTLGLETVSTGFWTHDVVFFVMSLLGPLQPRLVFNFLLGVRKRALKKKEKTN